MKKTRRSLFSTRPLLATSIYAGGSCLWVAFSDKLLRVLQLSPEAVTRWSILKGFFFVGFSSYLFYLILQKLNRSRKALEETVVARTSALATSEEALRRFEHLAGHSRDFVMFVRREDGRIIEANPAAIAAYGYSPKEFRSLTVYDLRPDDTHWSIPSQLSDSGSEGTRYETVHRRKDGSTFPVEVSLQSATVGDTRNLISVVRDITERKQSEHDLRASEERFRQVVEGAPEGIYVQTDGTIRYLNPAALAMFGAERAEQIVGQRFEDRIHADDLAKVRDRIRLLREDRQAVPQLEERYLRLDGTPFDVEVTAIPFTFGGSAGAIVFFRDLTARNQALADLRILEQQFRQAQKMEAIGRLAGGVAHDFNNLLMVISSYTETIQESLPANDIRRKNTQQVLDAADRAAGLTGQLLAFSRKQIITPVVLDLNTVVDETSKMLKRLIGEDIELRVNPLQTLWHTRADPHQIVQVLMNLCVNARDAMPGGGTLTISTRNIGIATDTPGVPHYIAAGEYAMLSVTDTGIGMRRETQEQIFEPFFTTKGIGKGTGLGLSTIYGILKQSGGYVLVESELGKGSRFTIYLPRATDAIAVSAGSSGEQIRGGSETILLVEDEEALREPMGEYLGRLGYTVLSASSGNHALAVASQHRGRIHLLLTDVVMPKMGGRELAQMLATLHSDLKTIYMSGYTDDSVLRDYIRDEDIAFLQKPFSMATLALKVREVINPAAPEASASA